MGSIAASRYRLISTITITVQVILNGGCRSEGSRAVLRASLPLPLHTSQKFSIGHHLPPATLWTENLTAKCPTRIFGLMPMASIATRSSSRHQRLWTPRESGKNNSKMLRNVTVTTENSAFLLQDPGARLHETPSQPASILDAPALGLAIFGKIRWLAAQLRGTL